jgi:hypothetical protein
MPDNVEVRSLRREPAEAVRAVRTQMHEVLQIAGDLASRHPDLIISDL